MPEQIEITFPQILIFLHFAAGIGLQYWESKTAQPGRPFFVVARRFLFHMTINPEFAILKFLAFVPVFLFTGKKYLGWFLPVKGVEPRFDCRACRDKGWVWEGTKKVSCSCRLSSRWTKVAESYR